MTDIPLATNDKGDVIGFDGQQWRAPDDVAVNDKGQKAYRFGNAWQTAPVAEKGETLNTLRIAGTAAIQGLGDVANIPSSIMGMAGPLAGAQQDAVDWIRRQFGAKERPKEFAQNLVNREANVGNAMSRMLDAKRYAEMAGIPTDPEAEAKRLGAEMTPLRKAISSGVRTASSALAMGAGPVGSLVSGLGSGVGQEVGGDTGAMIGSLAAPLAVSGTRAIVSRPAAVPAPGTTRQLFDDAASDFTAFKNAPAAVTKPSFQRYVDAVEQSLKSVPFATEARQPGAFGIFKDMRQQMANQGSQGFTLGHLWGLRDQINGELAAAVRAGRNTDKMLLKGMKTELDSYMRGLRNGRDALFGNLEAAVPKLQSGIEKYAKASASKQIEGLVEAAQNRSGTYITGRALDQAIRVEFRKIANNPKQLARFEPDVQDAIQKVAKGTAGRNVLSFLGRFSPTKVIPGMGLAAAAAVNPALAIPGAALAYGASVASGRMGLSQANQAAAIARGAIPSPPVDWMRAVPPYLAPVIGSQLAQ